MEELRPSRQNRAGAHMSSHRLWQYAQGDAQVCTRWGPRAERNGSMPLTRTQNPSPVDNTCKSKMKIYFTTRENFLTLKILCVYSMTSSFVFLWDSYVCKSVSLCVYICFLCFIVRSFSSFCLVLFQLVSFCFILLQLFLDACLFSNKSPKECGSRLEQQWGGIERKWACGNCNQNTMYEKSYFQ